MTPYQRYQLQWMIDHGYSLDDLIQELTSVQYDDPEDSDRISTPISELYGDWVMDVGFGSEIWVCEDEWREGEGMEDNACPVCGTLFPTDNKSDYIPAEDVEFCYHCGSRIKPYCDHQDIVQKGSRVWYVDFDSGCIEIGTVFSAYYKDGKLDSFSVEFDNDGDFDEFYGSAIGDCFFLSEESAKTALVRGR